MRIRIIIAYKPVEKANQKKVMAEESRKHVKYQKEKDKSKKLNRTKKQRKRKKLKQIKTKV